MKLKQQTVDVTSFNVRSIPTPTKAAFKAYCARHNYTMEAAMVALMKVAVSKDMTLPSARKPNSRRQR